MIHVRDTYWLTAAEIGALRSAVPSEPNSNDVLAAAVLELDVAASRTAFTAPLDDWFRQQTATEIDRIPVRLTADEADSLHSLSVPHRVRHHLKKAR